MKLDDGRDLAALVRESLAGVGSLGSLPTDHAPLDAVVRAYASTAQRDELARAVAGCLTDDDPSVRALAALFFERFPRRRASSSW